MQDELYNLRDRWLQALLRFKGLIATFPYSTIMQARKLDINMIELAIMRGIEKNAFDSDANVYMSDIQKQLFVTKAAISQALGVLEKKEYIARDVDRRNRRKTIVILTLPGREILKHGNEAFDDMFTEILAQMGRNDIGLFVKNIDAFADCIEKIVSNS